MYHLILYSKPGCHLCQGLQMKLEQIQELPLNIEVRDITTQADWLHQYEYEVPVVYYQFQPPGQAAVLTQLPRMSPRASVQQVQAMLKKYLIPQG